MEVYEITGFKVGTDNSGVNFLDPSEAFEIIENGYIYRQELKSRKGFVRFSQTRLSSRVMGIFEDILPSGDRELLVFSKEHLYKYSSGTDTFIEVPTAGTIGVGYSLGIIADDGYISGTSYFTKAGARRFVFCSRAMNNIFFYDGTEVKRFNSNNALDNPDYADPAEGALQKATKVMWFGERLNFFVPVIAGVTYSQGVLYSGIRDSAGNGDKFNVAGSGLISADTYEAMKGTAFLGDVVIMTFQRSHWTLEKTRDAFNPYFIRKIPSVLGTDATFSTVAYGYEVKSLGQTGLITTDGRQSLRFDDKIPYFTTDNIDTQELELIYGGFDRINGQFLFAYKSSLDNIFVGATQDKVLAYNYEESTWSVNDQRFSVFGETIAGPELVWDDIDETKNPSWLTWDTTTEIWDKIGLGATEQKTLAGDNEGFVYQINKDYDDYFENITNITQATNAVITVAASAFKPRDRILIRNVEGMTELNGQIAQVVTATPTSLTIDIDTTGYTAYIGAGSVSKVIEFKVEFSPFNPYRKDGRKCYVSYVEVLLDSIGGSVTLEAYEDEEDHPFKSVLLQPDPTLSKTRNWITATINQQSNFITFVLKNDSVIDPVTITSIRVHCSPSTFTSR
jgi:hypothetical protein